MKKAIAIVVFGLALVYAAAAMAGREWLVLKSAFVSCAAWSDAKLVRRQCADAAIVARAMDIVNAPVGGSLPSVDLALLRARLARIPGVADARLRRRLPDTLQAVLILRRPMAKWAGGGLVDVAGHRYEGATDEWLPIFDGDANRVAQMAEFYGFAAELLPNIGQVQLEDNGEWKLFLRDGAILYLGREAPRKRVRRYVRHRAEIVKMYGKVRAVDLRYGRGFALALAEEKQV